MSTSHSFPHLFTVSEVAKFFRLTEPAIRRMIRVRELPAIRLGREYRIPEYVIQNIFHPLDEARAASAGFGMWQQGQNTEGSRWVARKRKMDKQSLAEILKSLEA